MIESCHDSMYQTLQSFDFPSHHDGQKIFFFLTSSYQTPQDAVKTLAVQHLCFKTVLSNCHQKEDVSNINNSGCLRLDDLSLDCGLCLLDSLLLEGFLSLEGGLALEGGLSWDEGVVSVTRSWSVPWKRCL